jgi:hypothetical protein
MLFGIKKHGTKKRIYRVVVEIEVYPKGEIYPKVQKIPYLVRTLGSKSAAINTVLKAVTNSEVISVKAESISILRVLND